MVILILLDFTKEHGCYMNDNMHSNKHDYLEEGKLYKVNTLNFQGIVELAAIIESRPYSCLCIVQSPHKLAGNFLRFQPHELT